MIFNRFRAIAAVLAGLALVPSLSSTSHAAPVQVFSNPYELVPGYNDGLQSTAVVSFKANVAGTLSGYFVGGLSNNGNPVGFQSQVGVYVGSAALPTTAAGRDTFAAANASSLHFGTDNFTSNFGATLFGGPITVAAGDIITFVLKANINNSQCCGAPLNNSTHYVWSDERAPLNATVGTQLSFNSQNNAMAYATSYTVAAGGLTGQSPGTTSPDCPVFSGGSNRDCIPDNRNTIPTVGINTAPTVPIQGAVTGVSGTNNIAAGNYTFIGFNDWLGGPSNSYFDYALLAQFTASSGGSSGGLFRVPEPGTIALVLMGLAAAFGARRNRKLVAA